MGEAARLERWVKGEGEYGEVRIKMKALDGPISPLCAGS